MAEGPLVHYYARKLRRALNGKRVRVEFGVRKLKSLETSLSNCTVKGVEAYGKQFRIRLSNGRVILIHLMMWGSWGIYAKGEEWERPRKRAKLILTSSSRVAVVFSAPVVRVFEKGELERDPKWGNLGPDPLRRDFSRREFHKRLKDQASREIGEVLLDQTVISGVGNILRIEILFQAGIHPRRKVDSLAPREKRRILDWTIKLMRKWLNERDKEDLWIKIYRARSKPCPRCGGVIDCFRQGGRITYACRDCQI